MTTVFLGIVLLAFAVFLTNQMTQEFVEDRHRFGFIVYVIGGVLIFLIFVVALFFIITEISKLI